MTEIPRRGASYGGVAGQAAQGDSAFTAAALAATAEVEQMAEVEGMAEGTVEDWSASP